MSCLEQRDKVHLDERMNGWELVANVSSLISEMCFSNRVKGMNEPSLNESNGLVTTPPAAGDKLTRRTPS